MPSNLGAVRELRSGIREGWDDIGVEIVGRSAGAGIEGRFGGIKAVGESLTGVGVSGAYGSGNVRTGVDVKLGR